MPSIVDVVGGIRLYPSIVDVVGVVVVAAAVVVVVVGLSICSHSSSQPDDRHRGKVAHDGDVGQTSGMGHRGRHIAARHNVGLYL